MQFVVSRVLFVLGVMLLPLTLFAQSMEAWRGAWIADDGAELIVLYLVLRDDVASGTWCFSCANPDNLAFVDDSAFDADGLHYNLYFSASDGSNSVVPADARLEGGALHVTLNRPQAEPSTLVMRRPPPATPPPVTNAQSNQPNPVVTPVLPGPAEIVTADTVLGLWLSGSGPRKQYFIFKRHKDGIRGLVCGPCDSAQAFAPLENISMQGTNFHFDIVHEDNGMGFAENGPFRNVTDARIAMNEMQMTTVASFAPDGQKFSMTLLGPTRYMPRATP